MAQNDFVSSGILSEAQRLFSHKKLPKFVNSFPVTQIRSFSRNRQRQLSWFISLGMASCCCISGEPVEDVTGRIRVFEGDRFQVDMLNSPYVNCNSFLWFCGQVIPCTSCITQYLLRKKVLNGDLSKYSCFQGYLNCCGISAGSCGEQNCPECCLCCEAFCCNGLAVSSSRMYIMEKYDLGSDPCDYRLIRVNNTIQLCACVCDILALFNEDLREWSNLLDSIANLLYHCVAGCMTAQVALEVDYQREIEAQTRLMTHYPIAQAYEVEKYYQSY